MINQNSKNSHKIFLYKHSTWLTHIMYVFNLNTNWFTEIYVWKQKKICGLFLFRMINVNPKCTLTDLCSLDSIFCDLGFFFLSKIYFIFIFMEMYGDKKIRLTKSLYSVCWASKSQNMWYNQLIIIHLHALLCGWKCFGVNSNDL